MAVWEPANKLRKAFNWFAPIVSLGLAILYVFILMPLLYKPPLVLGYFPDVLAQISPKPLKVIDIIDICVVLAGVIIYYMVCFNPINKNELNIWPVDVITIVAFSMITAIGHWTGFLMFLQWIFVWFLGDDPIWELVKKKKT